MSRSRGLPSPTAATPLTQVLDTLTGGANADTFADTAAGLNGDTITDLQAGDSIVITDASLAVALLSGSSPVGQGG